MALSDRSKPEEVDEEEEEEVVDTTDMQGFTYRMAQRECQLSFSGSSERQEKYLIG